MTDEAAPNNSPLTSYAQNFEDVILWRALKQIGAGFYIDVGAQDPIEDSVSLGFYEKGWRGVHVEPTLHYAERLRAARPDEAVIQAAVAAGAGLLHFYEVVETGLSTGDKAQADQHRAAGFTVRETDVPSMPLGALLDRFADQPVHWLKIDVEGFEQQVLESWGDSKVRPWIVVVEAVLPGTQIQSHEGWDSLVTAKGYQPVYFDGLNRYYLSDAHKDLAVHFRSGPNVFDEFVLSGTSTNRFSRLLLNRVDDGLARIAEGEHRAELQAQAHEADREQLLGLIAGAQAETEHFHTALTALHEEYTEAMRDAALSHAEISEEAARQRQAHAAEIHLRDVEIQDTRHHLAASEAWALQMQAQIFGLVASTSWQVTRPLRFASRAARRVVRLLKSIPSRFRRVPRHMIEEVRKRPALKRLLMALAKRVPGLATRVRRFANPPAGPSIVVAPPQRQGGADHSHLTAGARSIRARLTAKNQ